MNRKHVIQWFTLISLSFSGISSATTLLGYYEFEGNLNNSSGSLAPASDADTIETYAPSGFRGQGYEHANSPEHIVNIPVDVNRAPNQAISFGGWINVDTTAFDGFLAQDNGGWDRGIPVNPSVNGPGFGVASGAAPITAETPVVPGEWQYVVGVFDGTTASVYAGDSVAATQTTSFASIADSATTGGSLTFLEVGTYDNQFLDGQTDDIFIFQDALNADQANAIRNLRLSALDLSPVDSDLLFDLFEAQTGSAVVGGLIWENTTGLTTGTPGLVSDLGNGSWSLVLDSATGAGVIGRPGTLAPAVIALEVGTNSTMLTWTSSAGTSYLVEYSTDLENWNEAGTVLASGETTSFTFEFLPDFAELVGTSRLFYRVEALD
jgi:hypothetical protein